MKKILIALLICLAFLLVACGSSDDYENSYEYEQTAPEDPSFAVEIPEQEISDFGIQVATEFLRDFWTVFDLYLGWRSNETGGLYVLDRSLSPWGWVEETTNMPRAFLGAAQWEIQEDDEDYRWTFTFDGNIYDAEGNLLSDLPFIRPSSNPYSHAAIADSFMLFDLDGDGIPEIIVNYIYWGSSGFGFFGQPTLFRFVDGAYRNMGQLLNNAVWFYRDTEGRLVAFFNNHHDNVFGYYYLTFTDDSMMFELASPLYDDWQLHYDWDAHHHEFFTDALMAEIFITNETIARFVHLDDAHAQISQALSE